MASKQDTRTLGRLLKLQEAIGQVTRDCPHCDGSGQEGYQAGTPSGVQWVEAPCRTCTPLQAALAASRAAQEKGDG